MMIHSNQHRPVPREEMRMNIRTGPWPSEDISTAIRCGKISMWLFPAGELAQQCACAWSACSDLLLEYGFTVDGAGLRALVAVMKSVSGGKYSADVEEAMTSWMHGGIARLQLETIGKEDRPDDNEHVDTLVVVFSSLGNGVIRPEFRGSLQQTGKNGGADANVLISYDVLLGAHLQ